MNEITNGSDQYGASAFGNAGYVMFDGYLTEKLRLGIGARLESYQLKLNSEDNGEPVNVDSTAISILPSANLIYNLSDRANIRLSGSQTIGRAEFRELAPFAFYDFNKNVNVRGNATLKQSKEQMLILVMLSILLPARHSLSRLSINTLNCQLSKHCN